MNESTKINTNTNQKNLRQLLILRAIAIFAQIATIIFVDSFLEIVGAMGLSNPSEIMPSLIKRRINEITVLTFDELFTYLKPGDLLSEYTPPHFEKIWKEADANKF
jgi:hypothetical protein